MRKPKNYDKTTPYVESYPRIPVDGYVVKILGAKEETYKKDGEEFSIIALKFDIAEGEQKDYYKNRYEAEKENQDDAKWKGSFRMSIPAEDAEEDHWTMKRWRTNIEVLEESNSKFKFDWEKDVNQFKGLEVGIIYREREYEFDGKNGSWSEPFGFKTPNDIRDGNFKIPKPKLLNESSTAPNSDTVDDSDVPF